HRKVRELGHEAAMHDGEVSPEKLDVLNRLARLVEVRDKTLATTVPRWRIAALFAATLVLISLLLFLRVPETQVEMQLVVSEVGFVLPRPQLLTGLVNLRELNASGLRTMHLSDPELMRWSAESSEEQKAVRLTQIESGTLTLDPLQFAAGTAVWLDADRSP